MRKIYTVTFHRANNYGAVIQAYALQRFLIYKKINTELLDYDCKYISNDYSIIRPFKKKNIIKDIYHLLCDFLNIYYRYNRFKNFEKFRKKLLLSNYFTNENDILKYINNEDIFIVGSDQVWNFNITGGYNPIYLLSFCDKIKKISYAASCGDIKLIDEYKERFLSSINKFDFISAREHSLNDYIELNSKKKSSVVIDPTLLLTKKDWVELISNEKVEKEKYIFTYVVDNANSLFYDTVNQLAKKTGYKIIYFDKHDFAKNYKSKKKSYYIAGPDEWLNLIYNAEYVVTTSFHGAALSTILNKEMFVILSTKPDRLTSLLDFTNLKDRIVNSTQDFDRVYESKINWDAVNKILEIERKKSSNWLINSIESVENE